LADASHAVADGTAAKRLNGSNGSNGASGGLTQDELRALAEGLVGWLGPLLTDLDKRIAELAAKPTMTYQGTWDVEKVYRVGDFVTNDGSLWHCERECIGVRPPAETWVLAVKKGRDGRGR
jgi:hypothetical protein